MLPQIQFGYKLTLQAIKPTRMCKIRSMASKTKKPIPVMQYTVIDPQDRRIYGWGLAEHGALATKGKLKKGESVSCLYKPKRISFGEYHKVTDIACGYGFTVFAVKSSDNNIVYGCGINTDSQIGYDESDDKFKDSIISHPRPIPLLFKSSTPKVIDMSAGRAHLLILTDEGVFTLGNNAYGQCGRSIITDENHEKSRTYHHIPNIKGSRITAVTAGQDHSMLLTENGEVYTFGWGADGQTGLAHYQNEYQPSLVKGDLAGQHIIKVACKVDCVLALSDKGKVFGWGNSEYGQLPVQGESSQVNIATELKFDPEVGHIVDIASGGSFCLMMNSLGNVYVWGYGILGLGPQAEKVVQPTLIPKTLFGHNVFQTESKVVKIYCGIRHMAALSNTGDLYTWGCNKFGYLGLGHYDDQFFPLRVSIGAQVKKVACGVDHTLAICTPFG